MLSRLITPCITCLLSPRQPLDHPCSRCSKRRRGLSPGLASPTFLSFIDSDFESGGLIFAFFWEQWKGDR